MSNSSEERRIDREIHRGKPGSDPFAAAMRATRMPMLITDPRQSDNPIVFVNDAFLRLTGYTRDETLGRNCRFLQGPGTNIEDVDRIRQAIKDLVPIEIDLLNYRKDGTLFWNRLLVSPVFDEGDLTYFFASQLDVTRERTAGYAPDRDALEEGMQQRIADLTASEQRLNFTLKAGGLGTWTLDVPSRRLVASAICKANFGRMPADTFSYEDLENSIHPDDHSYWAEKVADAAAGNGDLHVEYRAVWPDGSIHWIEVRAETRFDDDRRPLLMSGVSIDITERREAEAYRELMNREMSHRIKNILATVQSIVRQSLRTETPASGMQDIVAQRIEALGGAHDVLTGKDWDVAGLRQTVERAVSPFNSDRRIHHFGPDLEISHRASSALTMALHELATNAVKYGALSGETGRVRIEWSIDGDRFELIWLETGGPSVTAPTRTGFGSRMIERALSASVSGHAKVDYLPEGIRFKLSTQIAFMQANDPQPV
ncbi:MAG: PAS domain-containing protein [Candidatus Devosia phytovorans]|uniref:Blue-light-activated histidine kinase n=1 Tax=Candidatus Devosia phytovorans TaxID=3121372 RepID=A0AAJ5VUV5_9HYPH|nr:PAS domain-containing protein [Devosia sp.]WEK04585.1 MAG: PAS domain-containing protein [Devosia sp.]